MGNYNNNNQSFDLMRDMPGDLNTEKTVLGTLIRQNELFTQVEDILTVEAFKDPYLQVIFRCVSWLIRSNKIVDINAVVACSKEHDTKHTITEVDVMDCASFNSPNTFQQDVERLVDYGRRRKAWRLLQQASNDLLTLTENADEVMTSTMRKLDDFVGQGSIDNTIINAEQGLRLVYNQINDNIAGNNQSTVKTGFRFSDAKGGLRRGSVTVIGAFTSVGKALPMDANVLTPDGWVKNKDLYVGQEVCSIDGEKSFVTHIFKRGVRDMYNVTFSDGRVVKCCGEHLWEIHYPGWKHPHVFDTLELKRRQDGDKYHNKMRIPAFSGIFGKEKDFIIPPYVLGILIGDGSLTNGVTWTKPDVFIADKIRSMIPLMYKITKTECIGKSDTYHIVTPKGMVNPILVELNKLGLKNKTSKERFIPKEYLDCCREQRLELLNGLMDTDGYVSKDGHCVYTTTSEKLANDVLYLCHSLGFRASIFDKNPKIGNKEYSKAYNIVICSSDDTQLVTLPRKKERTMKRIRCNIVVKSVEYAGKEECQCIAVSHDRKLYVTDGFIMTHNTSLAMNIAENISVSGIPGAYYSFEMGAVELWARILSHRANVNAGKILNYRLKQEEIARVDKATTPLIKIPLYIDDKAKVSVKRLFRSIRTLVKRKGIRYFVIDYLQIMAQTNSGKEEANLSFIMRELKNLCTELDLVGIVLSQLRRDKEERHPTIDMLRGSGQIEESADNVVLIDRPEAHPEWGVKKFSGKFHKESIDGKAELRVSKGRNIGLGTYLVGFDAPKTMFYELDGYRIGEEIEFSDDNVAPVNNQEDSSDDGTSVPNTDNKPKNEAVDQSLPF